MPTLHKLIILIINLQDTSSHISIAPNCFISLQNFCWIFSQTCIFRDGWGNSSNLCCSDYWKMHLWVKNIESRHSYWCPLPHSCETLPQALIITTRLRKITHPRRSHVDMDSHSRKGGGQNYRHTFNFLKLLTFVNINTSRFQILQHGVKLVKSVE